MDTVVRTAVLDDAGAIARVHLASHLETYLHAVDRAELERYSLDERERIWRASIERQTSILRVAERDGVVVGFALAGPGRDEPPVRPLELWSLYLLNAEHGTGAGQALLDAAIGREPASLWVMADNPRARRFYERNGFVADGAEQLYERWGVLEVRLVR